MNEFLLTFRDYLAAGHSFGKVAVLYGGTSAEREISLRSGKSVIAGLRKQGVDVIPCDIGNNAVEQLVNMAVDRVFIALHGAGGEDGKIQALLDLLRVPYTGSRHTASAIAMDKLRTKQIWQSAGLPTPDFCILSAASNFAEELSTLGGEAFVKPVHEGSSIGMRCVNSAEDLKSAFELANGYDRLVIAERRIKGPEFSVALLNGIALPPIGLQANNEFYDYDAKYESDETRYQCPCNLSMAESEKLKALALTAFTMVGCQGWGRVDVMQNEMGEFYLLEVNTVPGMTDHSLVPMAACAAGMSFGELVCEILMQTVQKRDVD